MATTDLENPPLKYEPREIDGVFVDTPVNSSTGVYCPCKLGGKVVIYNGRAALVTHFKTKCHQKWLSDMNEKPPPEIRCKICDAKDADIRELKIQLTNLQNKMVDYSLKEKLIQDLTLRLTETKTELKKTKITVNVLQQHLLELNEKMEIDENQHLQEFSDFYNTFDRIVVQNYDNIDD